MVAAAWSGSLDYAMGIAPAMHSAGRRLLHRTPCRPGTTTVPRSFVRDPAR